MTRLGSRLTRHVASRLDERRKQAQWRAIDGRLNRRAMKPASKPTSKMFWLLPLALGAAATAGGALIVLKPAPHPASAPLATRPTTATAPAAPVAQRSSENAETGTRELALADGSRVKLQPQSRVVAQAGTERGAVVLAGSAEFDVVHDPSRPFTVRVARWQIKVLGTRFSVALESDGRQARVSVIDGVVEVRSLDRRGDPVQIHPGDSWFSGDVPERPVTPEVHPVRANRASAPSAMSIPKVAPPLPPAAAQLFARAENARLQGQARTAATLLQEILDQFPHDARTGLVAFELGKVLMDQLGDPRGASKAFDEALARAPDAHFREHLLARKARAFSQLGDRSRCAAARAEYLTQHPDGVHAPSLRDLCR
jgi:hypothetical protein